jgi:hypothetical protein
VVSPLLTLVAGARRRQQSQLSPRGIVPGPSSNPGRGKKSNFFWLYIKQLKVIYDIKNKFVWLKALFVVKKMRFEKTSPGEGFKLLSLSMRSLLPYLYTAAERTVIFDKNRKSL